MFIPTKIVGSHANICFMIFFLFITLSLAIRRLPRRLWLPILKVGRQGAATWVVAASVSIALPFGWGLGVVAALLMAGHDFGQLLALTVPLCIVAAVAFALSPLLTPGKWLAILSIGTGL
jgi:hypothetical protein